MAILHNTLQPLDVNPCLANYSDYCSYECRRRSSGEFGDSWDGLPITCVCPTGQLLAEDGRTCEEAPGCYMGS